MAGALDTMKSLLLQFHSKFFGEMRQKSQLRLESSRSQKKQMSHGLSITDLDFVVRFYTIANGQLREDKIRAPQQNED
jgi:hypothetical protein